MSKAGASTSRRIASSTQHEDAFGNITHVFTAEGPLSELRVVVDGEVDTQDTSGVVIGAIERFPPSLYLRETPLTRLNPAMAEYAAISRRAGDEPLTILHDLLERLHDDMTFDNTADRDDHHGGRGVRAQAGCVPGSDPHLHHRGAQPRHSRALHRRPFPPRRRRDRAGGRPRLGRGLRPGARLDRLRHRERSLRDRRPCARRGRSRLSGRRAGARQPLRRRRRDARCRGARQSGRRSDPGQRQS